MNKRKMRQKTLVFMLFLVLAGTSVLPGISGESKEGNKITTPTPRFREGGTPYDLSQSLYPCEIRCPKPRDAPASGVIAAPPEYTPVRGVLFTYKSTDWATTVRDLVVALTRPAQNDEIAYVVVSSTSQMISAMSLFSAGGANMSKVQFIIEPINAGMGFNFGLLFWKHPTFPGVPPEIVYSIEGEAFGMKFKEAFKKLSPLSHNKKNAELLKQYQFEPPKGDDHYDY